MRILHQTLLTTALLCVCAMPVHATATSGAASLQVAHPVGGAQTVRGVRRESVDHESFAAGPGEILEIVLADGSSVTLTDGAAVTIDTFQYDRATRLGQLVVSIQSGFVRVAGGVLNNTSAIRVVTPQGEARLDNGIACFNVHDSASDVSLLLGKSIALTANGQQSGIDRAHTGVHLTSSGFEPARVLTDKDDDGYLALLNPGLSSGVAPQYVADESTESDVSSEHLLSALNVAKDADVKSSVENSIQQAQPPPTQPPPTQPPPAPTLNDVTLGLSSTNVAQLNNLQWGADNSGIGALANAGGDSNDSRFFWPVIANPPAQGAPITTATTTTLFGGAQSGALWSASSAGVQRGPAIQFREFVDASTGAKLACDPTCGYGFVHHFGDFSGYYDEDRNDYLLITYPDGDLPAAGSYTVGNDVRYVFRMNFGTDWALPGNAAIKYVQRADGGDQFSDVFYKNPQALNPAPVDPTNTYLLLSGFTSAPFTVQAVATATDATCVTGTNAGCYKIWGATQNDPNPCTKAASDVAACSNILIELAHNRVVAGDPDSPTVPATFADGTQRIGHPTGMGDTGVTYVAATPQHTVLRNDDNNFLFFEATGTGTDDRHFLFGSGAVTRSAAGKQSTTLDTFLLSPGIAFFANVPATGTPDEGAISTAASSALGAALDGCAAVDGNCALSERAFFRSSTVPAALSGKLYDSGLLVLNPAGGDLSSVLHMDFGLKGSGATQVSTISGLFGSLSYTDASHSAALTAALVGSTYGPGVSDPNYGITTLSSQIVSTSAGGGNTRLAATGGDTRAGYMVLETGDAVSGGALGTEHPVHSSDPDVQFSSARLASGAGTQTVADSSRSSAQTTTQGYLAGLALGHSDGKITRVSNLDSQFQADSNLTLTIVPSSNTVVAKVSDWSTGSMGGFASNSAYIDNQRFGAADGTSAGIVSGPAVLAGWTDGDAGLSTTADSSGKTLRQKLNSFQYLQWGFFFGDSSAARDGSTDAHLASWVTGKLTAQDAPKPSGTAVYEGYMLGNVAAVANGVTSLYTAVGTFTNTWDFNVRQGSMAMSFDGADYTGSTKFRGDQLNAAKTAFVGTNNAQFVGSIASATDGRSGVLNGSFIDNPASAAQTHVGVLGRFDIGTSDGHYTASGTFGGEKKP